MTPLFYQGISYLVVAIALILLSWRFYNYYRASKSEVARLFLYPAVLGALDLLMLAGLDFFNPYKPEILFTRKIILTVFHPIIFIFLFRIVLYLRYSGSPKKQDIGIFLFLIPVIAAIIFDITTAKPPTVDSEGFVHFGWLQISFYFRLIIILIVFLPLVISFFKKMKAGIIRTFFLGMATLAGLGHFFMFILKQGVGAQSEMVLTMILAFTVFGILLTKGKVLVKRTIEAIEEP